MKPLLAAALSSMLCWPVSAATPNPEVLAFAKAEKPGASVVVKLVSKEKLKGTFVSASDAEVVIMSFKSGEEVRRAIPYEQIKSMERPGSKGAWIALGVTVSVVVLLVIGCGYARGA